MLFIYLFIQIWGAPQSCTGEIQSDHHSSFVKWLEEKVIKKSFKNERELWETLSPYQILQSLPEGHEVRFKIILERWSIPNLKHRCLLSLGSMERRIVWFLLKTRTYFMTPSSDIEWSVKADMKNRRWKKRKRLWRKKKETRRWVWRDPGCGGE